MPNQMFIVFRDRGSIYFPFVPTSFIEHATKRYRSPILRTRPDAGFKKCNKKWDEKVSGI